MTPVHGWDPIGASGHAHEGACTVRGPRRCSGCPLTIPRLTTGGGRPVEAACSSGIRLLLETATTNATATRQLATAARQLDTATRHLDLASASGTRHEEVQETAMASSGQSGRHLGLSISGKL